MTVALTVVHFHLCTVSPSAAVDMADTVDYIEGCWGSEIMFMSLTSFKIKCVFAIMKIQSTLLLLCGFLFTRG